MMKTVGILVASDQGAKGLRDDTSGKMIEKIVEGRGCKVLIKRIVSDDLLLLSEAMIEMADEINCHLILTTGGTGFSKRDNTPEATELVIEKKCPGIVEAMRWISFQKTPNAILSRAVAGIRANSIIVNLPGSPKAVKECLEAIIDPLFHGVDILIGEANECAAK